MGITARPVAGKTLLSRDDHMLVLIDFQSQMAFATKSIDTTLLRNNAALVSRAAASFNVPAVLTTVAEKSFAGPMFTEIGDAFRGPSLLSVVSEVQDMKPYLISLAVGVGILFSLMDVRSPEPPAVALVGLLGMLIGEQAGTGARGWLRSAEASGTMQSSLVGKDHL
ncbi:DUF1427 family protein [uncultured Sphingobium sp.]|uniref:DUF1427 family protein n=1 Tax=uncultured Sphingobium sp. TaxID=316087 RepID=UPI00343C09BE